MQEYVEKLRILVRLAQPGLDPIEGSLMLWPRVGTEERPETLLEHLNSARNVVPFIQQNDDRVVLLVRANVDWVAVKADAPEPLVAPPGYRVTHRQQVQLLFTDGNQIESGIEWDCSNPRVRMSDFLNASNDFFLVHASFGRVFVNRRRIRQIRIAPAAPELIER